MTRAVVAAAYRTPIGRVGGALRTLNAEALAAPLLKALLSEARLDGDAVDDVILGNAAGPGGNPARVAALAAGLPESVPGLTVDRQCGSGLEAVILAARLVEVGAGEVFLAGGVESPSTAPWRVQKPAGPHRTPRFLERARFAPEALGDPEMGAAAETVARVHQVSRARQDAFALDSHRKAVSARDAGHFREEIRPLIGAEARLVLTDECPRRDTSIEALNALKPVFAEDGTVTAGNACPVNDGAAAVLVMSEERFRALGLIRGMLFVDAAAAGVDPNMPGIGPVASTRRLFARRPGLTVDDIDIVEFNEAFAAQVLASIDALGIPAEKVSVGGGALALGHPWGASGAVLVCRLFSEMARGFSPSARRGLATLGIGGGLGLSALFEKV